MNLLGRVATTLGSREGENIASGALAYLLERYEPIRLGFLGAVGDAVGITLDPDMRFVVQRHDKAHGGFTDVSGLGVDGAEELIIEAKIGAGLQPGQIERYLDRLRGSEPVLVILAPRPRLRAMFADAVRRADAILDGDLLARAGPVRMVGLSWEHVATCVQAAAPADAEAEVAQVVGLYTDLEPRSFVPFALDDLAMAHGRRWRSIEQALRSALDELSRQTVADVRFSGYSTDSGSSFGKWATINGMTAWFGVWPEQWAELADTPFWLTLARLTPAERVRAQKALEHLDPQDRQSVWQTGDTSLAVALYPLLGSDVKGVGDGIAATVCDAANRLLAHGVRRDEPIDEGHGPVTADPRGDVPMEEMS